MLGLSNTQIQTLPESRENQANMVLTQKQTWGSVDQNVRILPDIHEVEIHGTTCLLMFGEARFTIDNNEVSPDVHYWWINIENLVYTPRSNIQNEIISSCGKWIELDDVKSNEVKPSPKDRYHMISLIYGNWKEKYGLKATEGWVGKGRDLEEQGKA